jgi:hypothetical protein
VITILPPKVKRRKMTPERRAREEKDRREARVKAETEKLLNQDKERARRQRPPRDRADYDDKDQLRGKFILRWVQVFGTREVQVKDLEDCDKELLQALEDFVDDPDKFMIGYWSNYSVGRILVGLTGKVFGTYTLRQAGVTGGATRWQVVNIAPSQFEEE